MLEIKLQRIIIWLAAIACFVIGFYTALDHSSIILAKNNYVLGPVGDDATDNAEVIYPIILQEKNWFHIFDNFADHRIVVERLWSMFDFHFTQGVQRAQPYRLAIALWANILLLIIIISRNRQLTLPIKILLSGCIANLFLPEVSIVNYLSATLLTWPIIMLLSLMSIICATKYCFSLKNNQNRDAIFYLVLTSLFIIVASFTFNIGLILWPILFVLLYRCQQWKPHLPVWISISLVNYGFYFFHGWYTDTGGIGVKYFLRHPIDGFLYFSRIVSLPIIPQAQFKPSIATAMIGITVILFSILFLLKYWNKRNWPSNETVIFSYFLFSFLAILIISVWRFWNPAENVDIGLRFVTPSLVLWLCILISAFIFLLEGKANKDEIEISLAAVITAVWLIALFNPTDKQVGYVPNLKFNNERLIALSTGIPIDQAWHKVFTENSLEDLKYLNDTQKRLHKSAYSLWPAQQMDHSLKELHFSVVDCQVPSKIGIFNDLRKVGNPAVIVGQTSHVKFNPQGVNGSWSLLITDKTQRIVGYGINSYIRETLWDSLFNKKYLLAWWGAINSAKVQGAIVKFWLANDAKKLICHTGDINLD